MSSGVWIATAFEKPGGVDQQLKNILNRYREGQPSLNNPDEKWFSDRPREAAMEPLYMTPTRFEITLPMILIRQMIDRSTCSHQ